MTTLPTFCLATRRQLSTASRLPPVIDLSAFAMGSLDVTCQRVTAAAVRSAAVEWGCFYVTNLPAVGLPQSARTNALNAIARYFESPSAYKNALTCDTGRPGFSRGHITMGAESGSAGLIEMKEAFSFGYAWPGNVEPVDRNALQGLNVWPDDGTLRAALETYFASMCTVSHVATRALSVALGHDSEYLPRYCVGGETISLGRAFSYMPAEAAARAAGGRDHTGSSEHTDWGMLTLILQAPDTATHAGLQVRRGDAWIDTPPLKDALFCNIGDFVSLLSGGAMQSPLHRVTLGPKQRQSLVYFSYPAFDARIPLPAKSSATSSPLSILTVRARRTRCGVTWRGRAEQQGEREKRVPAYFPSLLCRIRACLVEAPLLPATTRHLPGYRLVNGLCTNGSR